MCLPGPEHIQPPADQYILGTLRPRQELLKLCDAINQANPMHMCQAYYRQLRVVTPLQLEAVRVPVMLICGDADKLAEPAGSHRLAAALGARREFPLLTACCCIGPPTC